MDILVVATELSPYVRESAAAESITELSRALVNLGHEVTVVAPRFEGFEAEGLLVARRLTPLKIESDEGELKVTVFDGQLSSGIKLILLDGPGFGPDAASGGDASATALRLGAFCQAAAALVVQRAAQSQGFDAVHAHGWALAPLAALAQAGASERYVLTLHGADSPVFSARDFGAWGLSRELSSAAKQGSRYSPLLAGVSAQHWVVVGSAAVAREMTAEKKGIGPILSELGERLLGVPEGIDYGTYNPATDTALPLRYDATDPSGKRTCKAGLLRSLELDFDPDRPLVVMAGELSKESGAQALVDTLPKLMRQPLSLVVLGSGAKSITQALGAARWQELDNYRFIEDPDARVQRHALAAADFAIYLRQGESTARDVKAAQRYGAVPIALASGAYLDVVVDCDPRLEAGTGLLVDELNASALLGGVTRALAVHREDKFAALVKRVMRLDSSWERPARRYVQLYRDAPKNPTN